VNIRTMTEQTIFDKERLTVLLSSDTYCNPFKGYLISALIS
jgi:hypothetical protein